MGAVIASAEEELERAEAIAALRAREDRTLGPRRLARLGALMGALEAIADAWDTAVASHHDPAVVREAARFERMRARRA